MSERISKEEALRVKNGDILILNQQVIKDCDEINVISYSNREWIQCMQGKRGISIPLENIIRIDKAPQIKISELTITDRTVEDDYANNKVTFTSQEPHSESVEEIKLKKRTLKEQVKYLQDKLIEEMAEKSRLKQELNEYKTISIGLDIGPKDFSSISILQIKEEHTYCLFSKIYTRSSEEVIQLENLIKRKEKDGYVDMTGILEEMK